MPPNMTVENLEFLGMTFFVIFSNIFRKLHLIFFLIVEKSQLCGGGCQSFLRLLRIANLAPNMSAERLLIFLI